MVIRVSRGVAARFPSVTAKLVSRGARIRSSGGGTTSTEEALQMSLPADLRDLSSEEVTSGQSIPTRFRTGGGGLGGVGTVSSLPSPQEIIRQQSLSSTTISPVQSRVLQERSLEAREGRGIEEPIRQTGGLFLTAKESGFEDKDAVGFVPAKDVKRLGAAKSFDVGLTKLFTGRTPEEQRARQKAKAEKFLASEAGEKFIKKQQAKDPEGDPLKTILGVDPFDIAAEKFVTTTGKVSEKTGLSSFLEGKPIIGKKVKTETAVGFTSDVLKFTAFAPALATTPSLAAKLPQTQRIKFLGTEQAVSDSGIVTRVAFQSDPTGKVGVATGLTKAGTTGESLTVAAVKTGRGGVKFPSARQTVGDIDSAVGIQAAKSKPTKIPKIETLDTPGGKIRIFSEIEGEAQFGLGRVIGARGPKIIRTGLGLPRGIVKKGGRKIRTEDFVSASLSKTEKDITAISGKAITRRGDITEFTGKIIKATPKRDKVIGKIISSSAGRGKLKLLAPETKQAIGGNIAKELLKAEQSTKAIASVSIPKSRIPGLTIPEGVPAGASLSAVKVRGVSPVVAVKVKPAPKIKQEVVSGGVSASASKQAQAVKAVSKARAKQSLRSVDKTVNRVAQESIAKGIQKQAPKLRVVPRLREELTTKGPRLISPRFKIPKLKLPAFPLFQRVKQFKEPKVRKDKLLSGDLFLTEGFTARAVELPAIEIKEKDLLKAARDPALAIKIRRKVRVIRSKKKGTKRRKKK